MGAIPTWIQTLAAVLLGLASIGFFAQKADVQSLKAEVYQTFAQGSDVDKLRQEINIRLDKVDAKLDRIIERRR